MYLERLRSLRQLSKESQLKLAENINVTREAYSMYERGERQPSIDTVIALARHHNVSADYILGISDIPNPLQFSSEKDRRILSRLPLIDESLKDYILHLIENAPDRT